MQYGKKSFFKKGYKNGDYKQINKVALYKFHHKNTIRCLLNHNIETPYVTTEEVKMYFSEKFKLIEVSSEYLIIQKFFDKILKRIIYKLNQKTKMVKFLVNLLNKMRQSFFILNINKALSYLIGTRGITNQVFIFEKKRIYD